MKQRFDIVNKRKWFFTASGAITVLGLIVFLIFGFNLGTDFKAGSRVQLQFKHSVDASQVAKVFKEIGLPVGDNAITLGSVAGGTNNSAIIRFPDSLNQQQQGRIEASVKKDIPGYVGKQVNSVDPIVARQTSSKAVWSVLLASLFIVIYISIRFEYRFAISGIVALLHDAFIVLSVFALLRLEMDLTFVAAILTIVGYSINDTIVIFDRIRENLKALKPKTFNELESLVNKSLWQTMSRSINTVLTVLMAALMLFFFGGQAIHNFTFALIVGLVSGAYSSIFIASPLWVFWRGRQMNAKNPARKSA